MTGFIAKIGAEILDAEFLRVTAVMGWKILGTIYGIYLFLWENSKALKKNLLSSSIFRFSIYSMCMEN